jgi:type IV pilus assembly protein PilA
MLRKFFKSFKYGEKGFTLIELLVVIAILGVLAAVAIPNVSKFIGRGNVEAANTELGTIQVAVAAYQADNAGVIPEGSDMTLLGEYVQSPITGAYTVSEDNGTAIVTGTRYPAGTGTETAVWDATAKKWAAP